MDTNQTPNPFNPAALRLDQSFADTVGVKKLLTTVPVRKPNRQDFVRVHPDPAFRLTPAAIIEVKEDREVYLVRRVWRSNSPASSSVVTLYHAINRQGVLHLWPVKLPGPDGKHNEWHRSAAEAAERAMEKWVRVTSSMSLGAYEIFEASGDLPEPVWPDIPFRGNSEDRLPRPHRGPRRSPLGPATSGGAVAMAELLACRRSTDPVGGDTAYQHEVVAHTNLSGPAHAQTTRPVADTPLVKCPVDAGAALPEAGGGGAATVRAVNA